MKTTISDPARAIELLQLVAGEIHLNPHKITYICLAIDRWHLADPVRYPVTLCSDLIGYIERSLEGSRTLDTWLTATLIEAIQYDYRKRPRLHPLLDRISTEAFKATSCKADSNDWTLPLLMRLAWVDRMIYQLEQDETLP